MNIIIFGAAGRTGHELVDQALERGYEVTAFVHPEHGGDEDLDHAHTGTLRIVEGDVMDLEAVQATMLGHDAVLCAIGPLEGSPGDLASVGTRNIVDAMRLHGVPRLVCVTGVLVGHPRDRMGVVYRFLERHAPPEDLANRRLQEEVVATSGLDWTIVRPPRLTDGEEHEELRVGTDLQIHALDAVSRADLAHFLLEELVEPAHHRKAVAISA